MNRPLQIAARTYQRGAAAVEAALVIAFILIPLLALTVVFGKFFWHYTVVQRALHDAALYMAAAPISEIKNGSAQVFAAKIIADEVAELDDTTTLDIGTTCGYKASSSSFYMVFFSCSSTTTPAVVQAAALVTFSDPMLLDVVRVPSLELTLSATMTYAGN
jgi:Flp pilus assembly protein TadG